MMDYDRQLKLQAYLDGELAPADARRMEEWLAKDADAQALAAELRSTTSTLAGFEEGLRLPESREFFWSKIEREIRTQPQSAPAPPAASLFASWRRFLVPAGSLAALALVALVAVLGPERASVPEFESALNDPGAFTYRDYVAGTTLIWLSYPAENEFAEEEPTETIE